jgi:hypothetical protein
MTDYLTVADIVEVSLPEADMEIPEWGGSIKVRAITNGEFSRVQRQATSKGGELDAIKANALIIEFACVNPKFPPGGYRKLLGREAGILARIAETILELSGISAEEEDLDDLGEA